MAAVTSLSFSALGQSSERKVPVPTTRSFASAFEAFRFRANFYAVGVRSSSSSSSSRMVVQCMSSVTDVPTVSETKMNFLKNYKRPIPSIYNTLLQELMVQQHLMRYKRTYRYDAVFALGFVTVYDQLMDGYPSDEDRDIIFQVYIKALREDPEQYRKDAQMLEEWARSQTASSLVEFSSKEGEVEGILKDIAERAGGKVFSQLSSQLCSSKFEKLCAAFNISKRSVDRDLDVYRNLLTKLVQAKELLKEYVDREKKKREERVESQKANEAITKCLGEYEYTGQ
ncbi:Protein thylakoid formation 1, chloroplastic [Vitis vinifera]|uniref:Protein thylakoid formation 1, chloroplastic n=1 Tax=Vitis vinifera TaxID=29760 RepID=A0A438DQ87_VITVI|nr:Protein thylakoid formation 1, chloroplastic [Vitis vinifera]